MAYQLTNPYTHFWPLGLVTVAAAGTPVQLTVNVPNAAKTPCTSILLQNTHATATLFIMNGNVAKDSNYDQVVAQIAAGGTLTLSSSQLGIDNITPGTFYADSSASGGTLLVTAIQHGN